MLSEKVLIFDAETDNVSFFSFDKGMTDQQEYEVEAELAAITSQRPVTAAARFKTFFIFKKKLGKWRGSSPVIG